MASEIVSAVSSLETEERTVPTDSNGYATASVSPFSGLTMTNGSPASSPGTVPDVSSDLGTDAAPTEVVDVIADASGSSETTQSAPSSERSEGTTDPPSSRPRPELPPPLPLDQLIPLSAPADIIHSAKPGSPKPQAPTAGVDGAAKRSLAEQVGSPKKKFSLLGIRDGQMSPRPVATQQRLWRIFSPSVPRRTAPLADGRESDVSTVDHDETLENDRESRVSTASTTSTTRRRRLPRWVPRWLCACFGGHINEGENISDLDYGQQLKTMQPTYEPKSPLLPNASAHTADRICLVLDLDETLVHSSFTPIPGADFEIPLEMQGEVHTVYVKKRPGVDHFLRKVSEWYEIVVFTASLALYANPVMDLLDPHKLVQLRLYREHCVLVGGCYVKDIAKLGRDLRRTVIVDNSPLSYVLQPENAIPISAFFTDENDRELEKTLAVLEQARHLKDVRKALS